MGATNYSYWFYKSMSNFIIETEKERAVRRHRDRVGARKRSKEIKMIVLIEEEKKCPCTIKSRVYYVT